MRETDLPSPDMGTVGFALRRVALKALNQLDRAAGNYPNGAHPGAAALAAFFAAARDASTGAVTPQGPLTILAVGSSTMDRFFTEGTGPANARVFQSTTGTAFGALGTTGTGATVFGNLAANALNRDIRFIKRAVGGTSLRADWNTPTSTARANAVASAAAAGGVDAVIWAGGFNDARNNKSVVSVADHLALLREFFAKLRTELGKPNLPIFVSLSQKLTDGDAVSNAQILMVREAELQVLNDPNVFLYAGTLDLSQQADGIHQTSGAYTISSTRGSVNFIAHFSGAAKRRGPKIVSSQAISDVQTRITIQHDGGTDFTPTTNLTGFLLSTDNFATTIPVLSAFRESATTIVLNHNSTGNAVVTVGVRYMAQANPDVSGYLVSDTGLPMAPLHTSVTHQSIAGNSVPQGPTYQFEDTFSGTGGTSAAGRTSNSGHTLSVLNGTLFVSNENFLYPLSKPATAKYDFTPTSDNFDVTWDMKYKTNGPCCVALDVADINNYIVAGYNGGNSPSGFIIGKTTNGTFQSQGTSTNETLSANASARVEVRGESIKLFINDVLKAEATIAGRTNGPVGVRWGGSPSGSGSTFVHMDNLRVEEK